MGPGLVPPVLLRCDGTVGTQRFGGTRIPVSVVKKYGPPHLRYDCGRAIYSETTVTLHCFQTCVTGEPQAVGRSLWRIDAV